MYIFPWNWSRLSMFDYFKECTAPLAEPQSSRAVFTIDSS